MADFQTSDLRRWSAVLKRIDALRDDAITCVIVEQQYSSSIPDEMNKGCANCTITFHEPRAPAAYLVVVTDKKETLLSGICLNCLHSGRIERLLSYLETNYSNVIGVFKCFA